MATEVKTAASALEARLSRLVEEVLTATPHYLVDLDVRGKRGARVVDVYLDSDAALSVDVLARISRDLEFLLDTGDVLEGRFVLNVSSPGVDRPLKLPRQYKKNVGRRLRVHHRTADGPGRTETTGELVSADAEAIEVAPEPEVRRRILYDDIEWAKVQLPW